MKRTMGILLLVAGIALAIYGFTKFDRNTADIEIGDVEINAGNEGGQQEAYILIGVGVIAAIAGGVMLGGSRSVTA
ncbi:MAG: hypothetical protein ACK4TA_15695 [Saprospiraceae bacterium]